MRPSCKTWRGIAKRRSVLLLFATRDEEHNNALVLQELLVELSKKSPVRHGPSVMRTIGIHLPHC